MQFAALIYNVEHQSDVDMPTLMQQYREFGEAAKKAGVIVSGEALQDVSQARSVQIRDSKTKVYEGAIEATEQKLAGFYVLECDDLETAVAWAAKIPSARYGTIEVRPTLAV